MANFLRQQSTFLALNFVRGSTYYGKEFDAFGFNFAFQVTCTAISNNEIGKPTRKLQGCKTALEMSYDVRVLKSRFY